MNVLILGSGGREHAFAWKISQSPLCENLFVAPGNGGTSQVATNLPHLGKSFDEESNKSLVTFLVDENINLLVVGPEAPLVSGLVDFLKEQPSLENLAIVGPTSAGAQLEGSKDYAKDFMKRHQIPTAMSATFTKEHLNEGLDYLQKQSLPIVLKADGLAAGKGVVICSSYDEAENTLKAMLVDEKFGAASKKVVIEEYLEGIELSVFILTDGKSYKLLPEAKDYKRIGEKDTGPNTGGMGAVSPVPFADEAFMDKVEQRIVKPTIAGLAEEGMDYRGFIFIGLMNVKGDPFVIEYNVRMGDPETQVVLPRIQNDLLPILKACSRQKLHEKNLDFDSKTATTVVLVSKGYPEEYEKGKKIIGLEEVKGAHIFHAGTRQENEDTLTHGGRVLALTGMGENIQNALDICYADALKVCWDGLYYRKDIGQDLLTYKKV